MQLYIHPREGQSSNRPTVRRDLHTFGFGRSNNKRKQEVEESDGAAERVTYCRSLPPRLSHRDTPVPRRTASVLGHTGRLSRRTLRGRTSSWLHEHKENMRC